MPVHDWTRVRPGTFHDFHSAWIIHLKEALNNGLLPPNYYALAEQPAGEAGPDVLTLEAAGSSPESPGSADRDSGTLIAVAERSPKVRFTLRAEMAEIATKRRTLVIRHATGDRIVALVEILSPGNKHKESAFEAFLDKALSALKHGYHLLIIDLFPPGSYDPAGIHGALWAEIDGDGYQPPPDQPLTLVAYTVGRTTTAYVEPIAVGSVLPDMPLFLDPSYYVNVPLEQTYLAAWRGVPERWRRVIEAS